MAQKLDLPIVESNIDLPLAAPRGLRLGRPSAPAVRMALGLIVAAILVVTFSKVVNLSSAFYRLEHLNMGLALLCGVVFLSAYAVRALRWRVFLATDQVSVPRAIAIYQVATFVNWLLPVRGGELVKALLLRKLNDIPVSDSLPTVAMDKTMDLLPAVGLLLLLPLMPFQLSKPLWALLLMVLAVLICGAVFLALAAWRRQTALALMSWVFARFPGFARQRLEPFALRFVNALLAIVVRPRLMLIAAAYTIVAVSLDALSCLLAFAAVGATIAFPVVLYGYTFYNLAFILPTPPGQIGSNELIGLLVFSGLFHLNQSAVAAMFLFSHPFTAVLMVVSGLVCLSAMGLTLRSTLALTRERGVSAEVRA